MTAKFDSGGRLVWAKEFGARGYATALALDAQSNCYVTGNSPNTNNNDYLTIKYDGAGNAIWTNRWSVDNASEDLARVIQVDEAGQCYVLGTSGLIKIAADGRTVWTNTLCQGDTLAKLTLAADLIYGGAKSQKLFAVDTNGALVWSKDFFPPTMNLVDFAIDGAGYCYAVASSNLNFLGTTGDIVLSKFDRAGSNVWTRVYVARFHMADPSAVAVDSQGSIYLTGWMWNTNRPPVDNYDGGPRDVLTIKYHANGDLAWAATFCCPGDLPEAGYALSLDGAGNAYVAGYVRMPPPLFSTLFPLLLKYAPDGNLLWASRYGNHPVGSEGSFYYKLALGKPGQIVAAGWGSYRQQGQNWSEFLVVGFDDLTPRLRIAGEPAPGVRQGWLISPRWSQFDILATTNLSDGAWQKVWTVTNFNGWAPFADTQAGQYPVRFYRALQAGP